MNLLIIGAGGHGRVVAEAAAACGYTEIAFLDDNSPKAVGKISDLERFANSYEYAFVGIGNNRFRGELLDRLENAGYQIPVLIHPTAYVSPSAIIACGTVVEPKALVNANAKAGRGCIISAGAIIDHDAVLGEYVHANAGSVVMSGTHVEPFVKIDAGQVTSGHVE